MSLFRPISLPLLASAFLMLRAQAQIFPAAPTTAPATTTRPAASPFGNLPAAKPTQNQPTPTQVYPFGLPAQPGQPPQTAQLDSAQRSTRARIDYKANQLTITADNSSLTQILGDIGHVTGMKITGGVTDERVYGTYGPDTPQAVLTALLDGTSTNMLLLESPQRLVQELILTPRNGGPTPPSISTTRPFDRDNIDQPQAPGGRRPGGFGPVPGRRFQPDPSAVNAAEPNPAQQPGTPQPTTPNETTQQSPNGVKTPEQIYEQLIRQQQQQQTNPPRN